MIFSDTGAAMTPTSTKKGAKLYRYYVSMDVIRDLLPLESAFIG